MKNMRHKKTTVTEGKKMYEKKSNNKNQKEYDFFDEAIIKFILIDPINIKQQQQHHHQRKKQQIQHGI